MGFTTAADRQRTDAFIRHGIHAGFCDKNMPAVSDLVEDADDALFEVGYEIQTYHVLYQGCPQNVKSQDLSLIHI